MFLLIHRYIFKEWLKTLFITLMLIFGILMLEDMYKNLKTFLEHGASFRTLCTYYAYLMPNCLCTVLPISFFISVLYILNNMQAHNEIIALRASGMTVFQITRSFWWAAVFLTMVMFVFNAYILPYTSREMQNIIQEIDYNYQKKQGNAPDRLGVKTNLLLHNEKMERLWRIHYFSLYTQRGGFVTLSFSHQGREIKRLEAEHVEYDASAGVWIFKNGKIWYFSEESRMPVRFVPFREWRFVCDETPQFMSYLYEPIKYLGMDKLERIIKFVDKNNPRFLEHRIKYFSILSSPLVCLVIVLLAIPFSLNGVRTNPMVGVSKAVGLFFIYYVLGGISKMLGTQNTVAPLVAAWLPNLTMLLLGVLLYRRLTPR